MERDVVISGDKVFLEEFLRWAFKKWCPAALSGTTQESPGKHSGSPDLVANVLPKDVVGAAQAETPGLWGLGSGGLGNFTMVLFSMSCFLGSAMKAPDPGSHQISCPEHSLRWSPTPSALQHLRSTHSAPRLAGRCSLTHLKLRSACGLWTDVRARIHHNWSRLCSPTLVQIYPCVYLGLAVVCRSNEKPKYKASC